MPAVITGSDPRRVTVGLGIAGILPGWGLESRYFVKCAGYRV
jgi:hypothetical protein